MNYFSKSRITFKTGIAFFFLLFAGTLSAQTQKGGHVITVGTSLPFVPVRSAPFNAMYDYCMTDHFSLGLGYTHNSFAPAYLRPTRDNFRVRALYHFGGPKWDFFTGMSAGASIWSASFAEFEIGAPGFEYTVKTNQPRFTVQPLFGGRYMAYDWLGITSEVGFGAPYVYSFGLSMNITNTHSAFATMKAEREAHAEKTHAEMEKKNVVKLNVGTLFLTPGASYERCFSYRMSAEIGGSLQLENSVIQGGDFAGQTGGLSESDSISHGFKAYGMVRYYFSTERRSAPTGWYVAALYSYNARTSIVHAYGPQSPSAVSYDYEKKMDQHAAGLMLGYQQPLGNRFTIDAFTGLQGGSTKLYSVRYLDPSVTEETFVAQYGGHVLPLKPGVKYFVLKVSVGYRF